VNPQRSHTNFQHFFKLTIQSFPNGRYVRIFGFVISSSVQAIPAPPCRFTYIGIPIWFLVILTAIMPVVWVRNRRGAKAPGLCPICGYDLRATPDQCPECGEVVQKAV
jgi:hypothetical protein